MAFLEHLLEFLLVVTLFGLAVLAVTFFVARSYVRRHWRVLRGHVITRGLVSGLSFLAAGRERWSARATPEQLSQGTAARVRSRTSGRSKLSRRKRRQRLGRRGTPGSGPRGTTLRTSRRSFPRILEMLRT